MMRFFQKTPLLKVEDADGNDISDVVIDLWYAANEVYNVDDRFMFEMKDSEIFLDNTAYYYQILNYNDVVKGIFTKNGIKQLEETRIGGPIYLIKKKNCKIYRMAPWKTGYSYAYACMISKQKSVQTQKLSRLLRMKKIRVPRELLKIPSTFLNMTLLISSS